MQSRMKQTPDSALGSPQSNARGKFRAAPAAIGLLLIGLLATAGCSNNPYSRDEADRPMVYRALSDDPKTLDPSVCYIVDAGEILCLICNSYFQYDYLKQTPLKLELGIGATMPTREPAPAWVMQGKRQIPKTGELWSFRLKPGIFFQDD